MSRIAEAFATARAEGRPAFIPFITAGDPSPDLTVPLCEALFRAGADLIELGVPFSDPLADGPTIQRASRRALGQGVGLSRSLELAGEARARVETPLVLFTYYNPVLRMGEEGFADRAAAAGIDGVLVTDLPLEEGRSLRSLLGERGIDPILLVAPTSGEDRLARAVGEARGFIYYIARTGVTGARPTLPEGLAEQVAGVRRVAGLPVAVGFGISRADQVRSIGEVADGVVVGSALIDAIERALDGSGRAPADLPARLERAASDLFGRP